MKKKVGQGVIAAYWRMQAGLALLMEAYPRAGTYYSRLRWKIVEGQLATINARDRG